MKNLAKVSAAALLAMLLAACDKPANKTETKQEPAPAAQPAAEPKKEEAAPAPAPEAAPAPAAETAPAPEATPAAAPAAEAAPAAPAQAPAVAGAEDFKKLLEWQKTQEQEIQKAVAEAVTALGDKATDQAAVQEATVKAISGRIDAIKSSVTSLNIQDPEVKSLQDKVIELMTISAEVFSAGNPTTPEATQAVMEKAQKMQTLAEEAAKIQQALTEKFGAK